MLFCSSCFYICTNFTYKKMDLELIRKYISAKEIIEHYSLKYSEETIKSVLYGRRKNENIVQLACTYAVKKMSNDIVQIKSYIKTAKEKELERKTTFVKSQKSNLETINTNKELSNISGVGQQTIARVKVIEAKATPEVKAQLSTGEISINQAYQEIKKEEKKAERIELIEQQIEDIEQGLLPELEGLFDVVSVDPPWPYEGESKNITSFDAVGRRVANPYPEMSIEDIKKIEMPLMNDSVVLLWTTHKFLPDAFDILKEWNLEYKATLVWNKEKIGMGAWFRMQCEFCLVGIKGKPYWNNTTFRDILNEPRREHSRKPDSFFEMIEQITLGRRLEYFSREKRNGWEVFGNDINKF